MHKIVISKVFTDTEIPEEILQRENVEYGGTGFFYDKAPALKPEIEHIFPDYHLYDDFVKEQIANGENPKAYAAYTDCSIGFTTRGCIRQCKFCVNQNYTQCNEHSPVNEFLDQKRKYIVLLDDNVFACKNWRDIFDELIATGKRFCFKQGLDERLLTDEKCDYLFNKSKYYGFVKFAFDNIRDKEIVIRKLNLIREYTYKVCQFYTFCGFNHDDPGTYNDEFWRDDIVNLFERIKILMQFGNLPYIMRYKDYVNSPHKGLYIAIARWCNQPNFFKKLSFREFCELPNANRTDYQSLKDFSAKYHDIAKEYFDLKWCETNMFAQQKNK